MRIIIAKNLIISIMLMSIPKVLRNLGSLTSTEA